MTPAAPSPNSTWESFSFTVSRLVVYGLSRALRLGGLYRFGWFFGFLEWLVNFKRRSRFASRIRELLGEDVTRADVRRATLEHFVRTRCDKMIYLIIDMLPREELVGRFEIVNRHLLDEALAGGNGVYLAMSHHGAHHIGTLMLLLAGYQAVGVRDRREGGIRRYIQSRHERRSDELGRAGYLYSDSFPRDIYRRFQENSIVGSALDIHRERDAHLTTVEVSFFGRRRHFLTGPIRIAMRCGTPVLQGFMVSDRGFRYRLELLGPLVDAHGNDGSPEFLERTMQRYADNVEQYIRHYPDHITRI